jgi:hypothetical protein
MERIEPVCEPHLHGLLGLSKHFFQKTEEKSGQRSHFPSVLLVSYFMEGIESVCVRPTFTVYLDFSLEK